MKKYALLAGLALVTMAIGCKEKLEKHYPLQAEVISVDVPKGLIVVKHGEISGLMPAMTMQYSVADAKEIQNLQLGDKIGADLVVSEDKGRLEKIALISKGAGTQSPDLK